MIVRDSSFAEHEDAQAIELFSAEGKFLKKIGRFGSGPGEYYRLKDLSVDSAGTIWAVDVKGRVSRFHLNGEIAGTTLIQNPIFNPTAITLDEGRGVFYLAGCVPLHRSLSEGCSLIHSYGIADGAYQRTLSDAHTDAEAIQKNLFSLEDYYLTVDGDGTVYLIDRPVFKILAVSPKHAQATTWTIRTRAIPPVPLDRGMSQGQIHEIGMRASMLDRVVVLNSMVVVSVRAPGRAAYTLQSFARDGHQVGQDISAPGRLVGCVNHDTLLFAVRGESGFELLDCTWKLNGGPNAGRTGHGR